MGQYKKSTLTAAGERLVAQAIGGEIKLNITKVKTSNHQYPDGTNFKSLVDMDGIVQTMVGPKTAVYNDTLIQTRALFSNEEVKETYYIHNIGLYAMDGSEEVLFSISSATTPDEMPKYDGVAPTTCIYNIQNTISETSSVSLTINPAGYASIADIMELDEKKVDKTGDISETTINALDEPATDVQFPVPVAGESTKTFLGKVKKFFEDTKNWMTGVCLIGQIVNNCVTDNAKLPLSAAQGKVLMDLYTVLNTNFNNKQNREWIYAATLSNKNTASVGVNIRNYREACIIINGHRKSGSIMIVDDVLHFIAPEAGTGTMAFMYLVKVNIVNGGFGLYVEAANRICFLESNAWLENRNWSNSFNLYIR